MYKISCIRMLCKSIFGCQSFRSTILWSNDKYHAPQLTERLIQHCMPLALLWSNVMLGMFKRQDFPWKEALLFVAILWRIFVPFRTGDFGRFGTSEVYAEYSKFYAKKLHQRCQVKPSGISSNAENPAFVMFICNSACFFWGSRHLRNTTEHKV